MLTYLYILLYFSYSFKFFISFGTKNAQFNYFNTFSTSSVSLFLSNTFINISIIAVIINVTTYEIMLIFIFPFTIPAPATVDEITEGNLANVDISINLNGFIGSKPPI